MHQTRNSQKSNMLFVNADDLGWTKEITNRILTSYHQRRIHAASAMTFMKDSERAADLARKGNLPVGLHLNLTLDFTGEVVPPNLRDQHRLVAIYLNSRKLNQVLYNPFLHKAFDYVFQAQWEEFVRLYGEQPTRLDGHHHMHLCMNMLFLNKYPKGMKVRRNFTFSSGEKGPINRIYRYLVDRWLTSRFQCKDYFFSLKPIEPERIKRIVLLSKSADVELMVHLGVDKEYHYFLSEDCLNLISES
jgi:predicted glycoside hydrolase/deacetylase ChbG (UPF0249 family)